MTMVPMKVKCKKCNKKFFFNPDVGKMFCPRCLAPYTVETTDKLLKKPNNQ